MKSSPCRSLISLTVLIGLQLACSSAAFAFDNASIVEVAVDTSSQTDQSILGKWKSVEHDAVVEVAPNGAGFEGKLVSSSEAKDYLGTKIFLGLKFDEANSKWTGQLYSIKRGKSYDATWTMKGDMLTVKVKVGIFSKTLQWKRV